MKNTLTLILAGITLTCLLMTNCALLILEEVKESQTTEDKINNY